MLTANERMLKLLAADARTLARIDAVLSGADTAAGTFPDTDVRTVTFTDAAKRLGVSRPTVYGLVQSGRLDTVTLNGTRRVRVSSIVDFANGARPAGADAVARMRANAERNRENASHANAKGGAK